MTAASACGISATDFATMMIANTTSTPRNTRPATAPSMSSSFLCVQSSLDDLRNDRGCPVDVHDGHVVAGLVDIAFVQRPSRPDLAVQLHLAFVTGDLVEHQSALAFQRLHRVWQALTGAEVTAHDRADADQQQDRHQQENDTL